MSSHRPATVRIVGITASVIGLLMASLIVALRLPDTAVHATTVAYNPVAEATNNPGEVLVTWTSLNHSGFTVTSDPTGGTCQPADQSQNFCTVTGLNQTTTYTFLVTSGNGTSSPSNAIGPPSVAQNVTAVVTSTQNGDVDVSWAAPTSDGGDLVRRYEVTSTPGSRTCTSAASAGNPTLTCQIAAMDPGTYTFSIVTSNRFGYSTSSSPSAPLVVPQNPPNPPQNVTAVPTGPGSVEISWAVPSSGGGFFWGEYRVSYTPGPVVCTASTMQRRHTCNGLNVNAQYDFTVAAIGFPVHGNGVATAVKAGAPDAPTNVSATISGTTATVSWTPVTFNGGRSTGKYTVTSSSGGRTCSTPNLTTTTCNVTGLASGTAYTFTVTASNGDGIDYFTSVASAPSNSVTTSGSSASTPAAPTNVSAIMGSSGTSSARVSWSKPSDGGSTITGYTVTANPGGLTCTTSDADETSCEVTNLTTGTTYTFTVTATNAVGTSTASAQSNSFAAGVATAPAAPTNVTATQRRVGPPPGTLTTTATVQWTRPSSDGGSAITGYTVTASPGGRTCTATDSRSDRCAVTDLTPGTTYTFTVTATNAIGTSAASASSASLTIAGTPPSSPSTPSTSETSSPAASSAEASGAAAPTSTTSTTVAGSSPTATSDPNVPVVLGPPPAGSKPTLLSAEESTALDAKTSGATASVNGQAITPEVERLPGNATSGDPAERSPAEIASIRTFANSVVTKFNALSNGVNALSVRETPTGAVIVGLLVTQGSKSTPVAVPAERVMMVAAGSAAAIFVASSGTKSVSPLASKGLVLTKGGNLAMRITGVDSGVPAEIVLLSQRRLLGKFTTSASSTAVQIRLASTLTTGVDSVAIAVGSTRIAVRATIQPATKTGATTKAGTGAGTLPATGSGLNLLGVALGLFLLGMVMAVRRRVRTTA